MTSRVLSVLDAFSSNRIQLSLSEISRRTGMPMATAHRLIGELVAWGALERDPSGRYQIGLRLWEVAVLAPRGLGLRGAAMPFMTDLYEATHQNVQLAVLDGSDVVYLERISGRHAVAVLSRVGGRWPAHATGVGLVLLAHAPAAVQERYVARPLVSFTDRTIVDPARLRGKLAEVRRTGIAISERQITEDATSVAAPIRDAGGEVVAALSVVVRAADPQLDVVIPAVAMAARGITRDLARQPLNRKQRA
ncbi:transcriptional regulator [Paractinoplanes tereljensis]|uniref:Transcriptional regulator n=1 Tax=Paractinoplanes tereljensis TaxID=571912 RepID=A0A919NZY9_9ACTN|nr:transcriptional regulator [Actinoplanes tereljensis]